ncbi:MAG: NAD-dependent epimerase/dehydratase family protein, partial [bacterium]|nr:NAD-dependent epimerase/dehydratase family protein [bacterium]
PTINGDGAHSRDFTYIDNVVDANIKAATAQGVSGEIFNCACGRRFTLLSFLFDESSLRTSQP